MKVPGADGKMVDIIMGCYGIGPSRVMGSIVEVHNDERGMIWPKSVAPFAVHLLSLSSKDEEVQNRIDNASEDLYQGLKDVGVEVLWDDRPGVSPGAKFGDADLIGLPLRLVISQKTLVDDSVEWKERTSTDMNLVKLSDIVASVDAWMEE